MAALRNIVRNAVFFYALGLVLAPSSAFAADTDSDGVDDAFDTCSELAHPAQGDADGDGFGDPCDCDFDNDGFCNISDFTAFVADFIAGRDSGAGTDMSSDGAVNVDDFSLFITGFTSGRPGPGATGAADPAAMFPGVDCEGPALEDLCEITVVPGIVIEAIRDQLEALADGLHVTGDVRVPAYEGVALLGDATLVIEPGDGPFGFDTIRGTATLSFGFETGFFGEVPVDSVIVDLGLDLGENIEADIPLQPDLHYLLFHAGVGFDIEAGPLLIEGPGGSMTLLFNPSDPFFYAGAQVNNIPIPTPGGLFFLTAGGGVGMSHQGLIPFAPATTDGIAALFPNFEGHFIQQVLGELPTCAGCPTLEGNGYAILDLDPQEDGLAIFGPAETGGDVQLGMNGFFALTGSLGLVSLEVDLFSATGGIIATEGDLSTFVGGRIATPPDLFAFNLDSGFEIFPAPTTLELGLGVMLSSDPAMRFFRFEGELLNVGASGVVTNTGVNVTPFSSEGFFFQTGGSGTFIGGSTQAEYVVEGVRALEETSFEINFPADDDTEIVMRSRYEIGSNRLRQSTLWLSPRRIAQEGLLDMPNYTFTMFGEHTRDGTLLQGTLEVPIPYHYPALEAILEISDLISQQEAAVAAIEAEAGQLAGQIAAIQAQLDPAIDALDVALDVLEDAENALEENLDDIADTERIDCGCSECQIWNVVCWTQCGLCEGSQEATLIYLRGLTSGLRRAVELAEIVVLGLQGEVAEYQVQLNALQQSLTLVNVGLTPALAALSALYAQRDALPPEDGVFDAEVTLSMTREDLTGSVGGDFQGTPVGAGTVYMDGAPRACFRPPAPGAPEFCTLL